ncbi:hypothetical protein FLB_06550 [Flavobacterium succinicans]|uniref:Uncharacterized protein n=1 Tax=Flavobacterium succinicans TaxID=29536 RepID=A0A199XTQ2_9FLAO|nr:hypothetical protein FLB_06550 [Flavobacterium succinicans]
MEKTINDLSIGLFLWQLFVLVLLITIVYFVVKLYKKVVKYLDNKS